LSFALSTNTIAAEKMMKKYVVKDGAIAKSLTGKSGNAANGRKLAINRKQGNCLACHVMPIPEQPYHGQIGPDLNGVAGRLKEGEVRARLVNPKLANPDTIMPAFYKKDGFTRVLKKFQGKTMLSAEQVEDLVAYTMTLK
ncbi:MAG: sulfur oxidation c-type cytochrome SoxX, partial [Pseudomonadota bacterium]|nr:sulfur oxidation c-type cytochrome SoxX [Pseudomonadota bacterium]